MNAKELIEQQLETPVEEATELPTDSGMNARELIEARTTGAEYVVKQNPKDKLWYVLGAIRGTKFLMPVSDGKKSKKEAQRWAKQQPAIDRTERGL